MQCLILQDAHEFLERTRLYLFSDEAQTNFILSAAISLSKSHANTASAVRPRGAHFLIAQSAPRRIHGVALRTPSHRWIVSTTPDARVALADAVANYEAETTAERKTAARSLMVGDEDQADFLSALNRSSESRRSYAPSLRSNLMSLASLTMSNRSSTGLMRLANDKDFKVLSVWSQRFAVESGLNETPTEASEIVQKYIDHRQLYVWENGAGVVAMAATGGFTPKTTRVSQVYTPPDLRGRGYGTTLVHRLSHRIMTDKKIPVLLADTENLTTKKIYEGLGYRTIATLTELRPQN